MPQYAWLDPGPFELPGGPIAALLIHGFTGSPPEMRPLGDYLSVSGITVSAPLLPGHGTTVEDLIQTRWEDWYGEVELAFRALKRSHDRVFAAGLSLGSLLALHLAAREEVAGVAALSPALTVRDWRTALVRWGRHLVKTVPKDPDPAHSDLTDKEAFKRFWSYDEYPVAGAYQLQRLQKVVRAELQSIRAPALVAYSTRDMAIHPQSGPTLYRELGSEDKDELVLHNSGHGIVLDVESPVVFERVRSWIASHSEVRAGS
jgi:carboxylesterase